MAGTPPAWTTPGPATHSNRLPAARACRIPSATWRTSTACGRSSPWSAPNVLIASAEGSELGTLTWMPAAPTTMRMPRVTSDIGTVRTRGSPAADSSTTRPQSISGWSTSYHRPPRRTRVSRLVVA